MDTPYGENDPYHIFTGHLPSSERLQSLVDEAYRRFRSKNDGELARRASIATPSKRRIFTPGCARGTSAQGTLPPSERRSRMEAQRSPSAKHDRLMKMGFRMHPKYSEPQTSGKSTLWSLP